MLQAAASLQAALAQPVQPALRRLQILQALRARVCGKQRHHSLQIWGDLRSAPTRPPPRAGRRSPKQAPIRRHRPILSTNRLGARPGRERLRYVGGRHFKGMLVRYFLF